MEKITIKVNSQQVELLKSILENVRMTKKDGTQVIAGDILNKLNGVKEVECEEGHICTNSCGNDKDCPCESDHCCSMTSKDNLCGDIEDCAFCASKVPDLADLANDNLNER